jgi:mycothiol synthase
LISRHQNLDANTQVKILDLIARATEHDGIPPVAEHVLLHLRHGGDKDDFHLVASEGDEIFGYAHLDMTDER